MTKATLRRALARSAAAIGAAAAIGLAGATGAIAQTPDPAAVVATVNDRAITEGDLAIAEQDFAQELARVPPEARRKALISAVVDLEIVRQAAEAAGLDDDPDYRRRLALTSARMLRSEYVRQKIGDAVTDEVLRERYDAEVARLGDQEEVKASHILVETEDEAKAIITELKGGADFATVAKEKSKDTGSGAQGGDLGFFGRGMMVPEFEQAAFALEPGAITETPVKSQFGFHVIRLEERRKKEPPAFEQVKEQIRNLVVTENYVKSLEELKNAAKITINEDVAPPAGAGEAPADGQPGTAPAQ